MVTKMKPPTYGPGLRYNGRLIKDGEIVDVLALDVDPLRAEGWTEARSKTKAKAPADATKKTTKEKV